MSRNVIICLVLTTVLLLSGCEAQPEKNVEEVSGTQNALSTPDITGGNIEPTAIPEISVSPEISGSDPAPSGASEMDVTYEVRARLHKDMPEYRFVANGITRSPEDYGVGFVLGMEVLDEKGALILSADFSETYGDEVFGNAVYNEMMDTMGLHIVDVNFDGYKDVIVLNDFSGAHGNTWYNCWLWDQKTSSFVEAESFTEICNPALDPANKCIYSAGGSGAEYWGGSIYKFMDGQFVMTNNLEADSGGLTETELINGDMVVVRKVSYATGDTSADDEMQYYNASELWQLNDPRWYMVGGHEADQWLGGK